MVDTLGKRYGYLPSEVLGRANTLDLYVMDAALSYEQYQRSKDANGGKEPVKDYTLAELQDILNKTKG